MENSCPGNSLFKREKAVEELVRGYGFTNRLKLLVDNRVENDGVVSSMDLSEKILDCFTNALSLLSNVESCKVSQTKTSNTCVASQYPTYPKIEDSEESIQNYAESNPGGSYNRRKTSSTNVRTREDTPTLVDDGYSWRKYGQKEIQRFKYPRCYFRCTYKIDQGCQASKHVQQIQDNPPLYRTTYFGQHICKNLLTHDTSILENHNDVLDDEACRMIRFDKQDQNDMLFLSRFQPVEEETEEETKIVDHHRGRDDQCYTTDNILSPDMMMIDSSTMFGEMGIMNPLDLVDPFLFGF